MKRLHIALLLLLFGWYPAAHARLTIEITGGTEGAQPIAIVPFGVAQGITPTQDVAGVIAADLARTGRFNPMPRRDMVATPHTADQVDLRDWRRLGMDNLVVGQIKPGATGGFDVNFVLFDVFSGRQLEAMTFSSTPSELRYTAHLIADKIYQRLTGTPGVFATRIASVTSERDIGGGDRVTLRVADADGYNPQTIVASKEPIMSPAWSPDGRRIAYVSFENRFPAIYIQELSSGRRERIAAFQGLNGSPAFAPDGRHLAMTLSKSGNPEIWVMDLDTRALTQLTNNPAIDTEPAWSVDGSQIVFTSDRGGSPQIYRMPASGGEAQRVTFTDNYNGRASYSPDGRSLVLVTRANGSFRIGLLKLATGALRTLSDGPLDESPSFAPNGSMVIYASQSGGRGVLAAVSVDGKVSQRLSQDLGDVREPAWSPFIRQ
jgi:TolB protein